MKRVSVLIVGLMLLLAPIAGGSGVATAVTGDDADAAIDAPTPVTQTNESATTTTSTNETNASHNETTEATDGTAPTTTKTTEATTDDESNETATNESETALPPGAAIAGILEAQGAEHQAAVEERTMSVEMRQATTNASKAGVVASHEERIRTRLSELQNGSERVENEYEADNISQGEYVVRTTALGAHIRGLERMINTTRQRAHALPESAREARGLSPQSFDRLANQTRTLTGPNASSVAMRVAGPSLGTPIGPADRGMNRSNRTTGQDPDRGAGHGADRGNGSSPHSGSANSGERENSVHTEDRGPSERSTHRNSSETTNALSTSGNDVERSDPMNAETPQRPGEYREQSSATDAGRNNGTAPEGSPSTHSDEVRQGVDDAAPERDVGPRNHTTGDANDRPNTVATTSNDGGGDESDD